SPERTIERLHAFPSVELVADGAAEDSDDAGRDVETVVFPLKKPEAVDRDMPRLAALVRDGMTTIILCDNQGQAERLDELLSAGASSPSPAGIVVGVLGGGFIIPPPDPDRSHGLRVLTDHEIFRRERRMRRARKYS